MSDEVHTYTYNDKHRYSHTTHTHRGDKLQKNLKEQSDCYIKTTSLPSVRLPQSWLQARL